MCVYVCVCVFLSVHFALTLSCSSAPEPQSFSVDAHKTLNTPYDCGILLCTDADALTSALQASGAYISYGAERDGMRCVI